MNADLNLVTQDPPSSRAAVRPRRPRPLDALVELTPWLEAVDTLLQQQLVRQQQRGDDRFDMQGIMRAPDEPETTESQSVLRWLETVDSDIPPVVLPEVVVGGRMAQLGERFGLSSVECGALILGLLPLMEPRYGALIAYLQGDEQGIWPTVDLALTVFCRRATERIASRVALTSSEAPLLRHGLMVSVERSGRLSDRGDAIYLRTAETVFRYLNGQAVGLPRILMDLGGWLPRADVDPSGATAGWDAIAERIGEFCFGPSSPTTPILLLQGGNGRESLITQLASESGYAAFGLNLNTLPENSQDAWEVILAALHVTRLTGSVLVLRQLADFEAQHDRLLEPLDQRLAEHGQPVIVLTSADEPVRGLTDVPRLMLNLPPRVAEDDVALMQTALQSMGHDDAADFALTGLLKRTRVNPDRLSHTLIEAEFYRTQRDTTAPLTEDDLYAALKVRAQQHFGRLAQRIEPRRRLKDLVASDALMEQLGEILAAIRQREALLRQGFADKIGYGTGISALFYGDSGTGKTMAAEVLAAELGLDLIRVDLATVVNKYIGETEKNLSKIFDLAVADTGVLLFDEADALFGKRSEVKDAQDRHANIEVSYLLQRLEQYPGLVVLSTNNRGHLDDAFTRRLTFMTYFETPDVALRERLWRAIWPAQVAVSEDIDWSRLARLTELTGAGIRNVALLASWLAAEAGRAVTLADIERAVRRELGKTGRLTPRF